MLIEPCLARNLNLSDLTNNLTAWNNLGNSLGSGYRKFPDGIIMQWGEFNLTSTDKTNFAGTITFPVTFPVGLINLQVSGVHSSDGDGRLFGSALINSSSKSSAVILSRNNVNTTGSTFWLYYLAIGS